MSVNQPGGGTGITPMGAFNSGIGYNPGAFVQSADVGFLCGVATTPPFNGAPQLDGSALVHGVSNTGTITLTTTGSNDLIVVAVAGGLLSSISDVAGLTWTRRGQDTNQPLDVWTAPATAPLTADVITFNFASPEFFAVCAFGAQGFTVFDPHAGLPLTGHDTTLNLTTTNANDMLLVLEGTASGVTLAPPAGFTTIQNGGASGVNVMASYQRVSATQSGVAFVIPNNVSGVVDALTGISGAVNPVPGADPTHWIGTLASGTWTPTDVSGAGLTLASSNCHWWEVGDLITLQGSITYPTTADGTGMAIGGLPPFTVAQIGSGSATVTGNAPCTTQVTVTGHLRAFNGSPATALTNAQMSAQTFIFNATYRRS